MGNDSPQFEPVCLVIPQGTTINSLLVFLRSGVVTSGSLTATLYFKDLVNTTPTATTISATVNIGEEWSVSTQGSFTSTSSCTCIAVRIDRTTPFAPNLSDGISVALNIQ